MSVIEMCYYYGYDLERRKTTCDKGHRAGLKCHSKREDCPDYVSTSERAEARKRYIEFLNS